jgi:hypothetical protein
MTHKLPSAKKSLEARVAVLHDQDEYSREDALRRILNGSRSDVPRLLEELESLKAQRAKFDAKVKAGDVAPNVARSKAPQYDAAIEQGQAHVELERSVGAAAAAELGLSFEPAADLSVGAGAHDATIREN